MFKETHLRCLHIFKHTNIKVVLKNCSAGSRMAEIGGECKKGKPNINVKTVA